MRAKFSVLPHLLLALTLTAPAFAASTGSGSFRLDKVKSTFNSACGYRLPNADAPGSTQVAVILASKPLDCARFNASFTPLEDAETAIAEQGGATATLKIAPSGDSVSGNWRSADPSDGFSFGGQGEVKLTKNTDTRVEGTHRTKKPESFFDKTFEFDFKFAVDVLGGALEGTPLPKGGGEPGKAFTAYTKALVKKDEAAVKRLAAEGHAPSLEWGRDYELKEATISGGLLKGTVAALDVEGTTFAGDKQRGRVFMVQEGGTWKVRERKTSLVFD
jgi:hypothetical protein